MKTLITALTLATLFTSGVVLANEEQKDDLIYGQESSSDFNRLPATAAGKPQSTHVNTDIPSFLQGTVNDPTGANM